MFKIEWINKANYHFSFPVDSLADAIRIGIEANRQGMAVDITSDLTGEVLLSLPLDNATYVSDSIRYTY